MDLIIRRREENYPEYGNALIKADHLSSWNLLDSHLEEVKSENCLEGEHSWVIASADLD